jgi:hypothetical protein
MQYPKEYGVDTLRKPDEGCNRTKQDGGCSITNKIEFTTARHKLRTKQDGGFSITNKMADSASQTRWRTHIQKTKWRMMQWHITKCAAPQTK